MAEEADIQESTEEAVAPASNGSPFAGWFIVYRPADGRGRYAEGHLYPVAAFPTILMAEGWKAERPHRANDLITEYACEANVSSSGTAGAQPDIDP